MNPAITTSSITAATPTPAAGSPAYGWSGHTLSPRLTDETPVDALAHQLQAACGRFAVIPVAAQRHVQGGVAATRLSGLDAVLVSQDLERVSRDAACIRQDPGEHFFLIFQDHGEARITHANLHFSLLPGDVALIDATRPLDFTFGGRHSQQLSVHLPRDELIRRFGARVERSVGLIRQDALGLAMRAILCKMLEPGHDETAHLKEAFLGVLGSLLLERERGHPGLAERSTASEALLQTAIQHIARRCHDSDFQATDLADVMHMSPRSLQRLFQRLGESPSRRILNMRLDAAREQLAHRHGAAQVASIAYACGFNDLSFFYREFRKRFGMRPGAIANPR